MNSQEDNSPASVAATGKVRLFPLPNLVMFPHVVQPLHLFEPRYCEMLEDALAGDRQIAMVLLARGWERDYEGRPAIAPVACIGKVIAHERLPAGRHNILLRGVSRAVIRQELPPTRSYREAEVELVEDFYPPAAAARRGRVRRKLVGLARRLLPDSEALNEQLDELLSSQLLLGTLTDIFVFTLGFPSSLKQRLLAETNVDERAAWLRQRLESMAKRQDHPVATEGDETFPPRFSVN